MKPDIPALIILTQREHQRLNNPIKRLQTYALDEKDLQKYSTKLRDTHLLDDPSLHCHTQAMTRPRPRTELIALGELGVRVTIRVAAVYSSL